MKQQDLKALSAVAVKRAVAARKAAGVELSATDVDGVAGGFYGGATSYIIDPHWLGIWDDMLKNRLQPQLELSKGLEIGPDAKLEAGIAAGKIAF